MENRVFGVGVPVRFTEQETKYPQLVLHDLRTEFGKDRALELLHIAITASMGDEIGLPEGTSRSDLTHFSQWCAVGISLMYMPDDKKNARLQRASNSNKRKAVKESADEESAAETIQYWFEECDLNSARENLDNLFEAAMAESYAWGDGPPGCCLLIYDQMLALIKAGDKFLSSESASQPESLEKIAALPELGSYMEPPGQFPKWLNSYEWLDPMRILGNFFRYKDVSEWETELHTWLDASLSCFSVTTNVDLDEITAVCRHLYKYVEACYSLKIQLDSKQLTKPADPASSSALT